ncbi:aminopeptidase N-like [Bacillus rossius redtenbacheri]|uniref:aminopeptidase N-like n=1 Tax=Bacillus rossius redtenbacheri TaxID=93214 RepID=UPI002FDCA986
MALSVGRVPWTALVLFLAATGGSLSEPANKSRTFKDHPNSVYYDRSSLDEVQLNADTQANDSRRLPTSVWPESYLLWLVPHLDDGSFLLEGRANITLLARANTSSVTLNAADLAVEGCSVSEVADGAPLDECGFEVYPELGFLVVNVTLEAGRRYQLSLKYSGRIGDGMSGFYRSYYYRDGEKRWLAATQFSADGARRAFPCFDEPAFKARFQVNIARDGGRHSLSNMPVDGVPEHDSGLNLTWDRFEETPMPMATYLVAFLVSDFASVTSADGRLRTWQRGDAVRQGDYSATFSPDVLAVLENYTGVDYFLPKLDQEAVPDFAAGAMENWGLVKYRERNLLFDEGNSTSSNKQRIAEVIAHELAHMWFGNLVTPAWWSYLWLSEGFATFFQYFAAAQVEPEMRLAEQFVMLQHHTAFQTDSLLTTHPMTKEVLSTEIGTLISQIVYNKAASVLRMTQHFLTSDVFYAGLNIYLTQMANGTAVPEDLFAALQEAYSQQSEGQRVDVVQVLDSWTSQPGYPVLTVTRDYAAGSANISQKRFFLSSGDAADGTNNTNYTWWIPITYTTQRDLDFNSTAPRTWLNATEAAITNMSASRSQWVIFNIQETGFYRVNYDPENWRLLAGYLDSEYLDEIHVLNRAQLLDDALNLARAGQLEYSVALPLTRYLARETDYIAWYPALAALSFLDQRLRGLGEYPHHVFQTYILTLLEPLYKSLGFEERPSDDHTTKLLRNLVLTWECNYGQRDCVSKATELFNNFTNNETLFSVPPDLRSVVYCAGLRHGGEREWQFLWDRLGTTQVATEEGLIMTALGCTRNETLAHRYLENTIDSNSTIRPQDISSIFPALKEVVANITADIGSDTLLSSLQSAETNLQWLQTHGAAVSDWLKQQDYRLPTSILPDSRAAST